MRLLSELFPNFVKKSQIERISKGPFGEGLDASELKKDGLYDNIHAKRERGGRMRSEGDAEAPTDKDFRDAAKTATKSLTKARTYLKPGEEPPQGVKVQSGPQGGRYYEEEGTANWGRGSTYGDAQGRYDDMDEARAVKEGYDSVNQTLNEIDAAKPSMNLKNEFYRTLAAKQQEVGRQVTPDEYKEVLDDTVSTLEAKGKEGGNVIMPSEADKQTQGFQDARAEIDRAKNAKEMASAYGPEAQEAYEADRKQRQSQDYQSRMEEQRQSQDPNQPLGGAFGDVTPQQVTDAQADVETQQAERDAKQQRVGSAMDEATGTPQRQEGTMSPSKVEILRSRGELPDPTFDGPRDERGYLKGSGSAEFDGQGNVHLPGYDPLPIGELAWEDAAQGGLLEQYTAETGGSMENANMLLENTVGSLDQNYLEEVVNEQASFMVDRGSRIDPPSYDISGDGEDALDELGGFFDWLNSKSGTETMKMAKMMQTHNVDIKKRDPIVLANKGGNQRRNAYVRGIYKK
jgi:hypothetical protein